MPCSGIARWTDESAGKLSHSKCMALRFQLQTRQAASQHRQLHQSLRRLETASAQDGTTVKPSHPTPTLNPKVSADAPAIQKLASKLRETTSATEPYAAYGTTESLFKACAAAGDYSSTSPSVAPSSSDPSSASATSPTPGEALASGSVARTASDGIPLKTSSGEDIFHPASSGTWHNAYALSPTFSTWAHLTILHLYLLLLRIRQFPAQHAKRWEQNLLDHFFYAAEERMEALHGLSAKSIRGRYLRDLFDQYRGAVVSYDEGILKGDAVLATALWRNLFGGKEDVDAVALAEVVGWLRRVAEGLSKLGDAEFAAAGWRFGEPWKGAAMVEKESLGLKQPLIDESKAGS